VRGIVFYGFPLHAAGRPSTSRGTHLARVAAPLLFLQGTRDTLADLTLLTPIVQDLGDRATLQVIEDADHGFHVRKSSGKTDAMVLDALAEATATWARSLS
jgi:predicted alpha/beta-hydrolase family hydrolase